MSNDKSPNLNVRANQQIDNPELVISNFFDCYHYAGCSEAKHESGLGTCRARVVDDIVNECDKDIQTDKAEGKLKEEMAHIY